MRLKPFVLSFVSALMVMAQAPSSGTGVLPTTLNNGALLEGTQRGMSEAPRELTPRGLVNLVAFAKALNYVRFFHPSDESAKADWNWLAAEGVRVAEDAISNRDLAKRLTDFFGPYAPSTEFLVSGQRSRSHVIPKSAAYLVRWSHRGFGQNQPQSAYKSIREYISVSEWRTKDWADPRSTKLLNLVPGLDLSLPRICPVGKDGATLPKASLKAARTASAPLPEPTGGSPGSGDSRSTRLGDVVLTWGIFQHFYPYFEAVHTDWVAELPCALRSAAIDKSAESFIHTLRRMTATLQDGHVRVAGPDYREGGWPSLVLVLIDGKPVVRFAGPSAKAVPVGSQILAVDGEPVEQRLTRMKLEISAATTGWMEARLSNALLAGDKITPAKVSFRTVAGDSREAILPRDTAPSNIKSEWQQEKEKEVRPGIWYVDLNRTTNKDFEAMLPRLSDAKAVIFDLRGYPKVSHSFLQHLTDKPIKSAIWNVPVIHEPDGQGWSWDQSGRWNLEPLTPRIQGKVAFLTGGGAISYAESCLGIIEAYRLAEIVGEPTAGTNGNINPFPLPGGYRISWTGMKVLKHDGSQHHGVGIRPTVPVKPTQVGLAEGRDEVLEKAIEVVSNSR